MMNTHALVSSQSNYYEDIRPQLFTTGDYNGWSLLPAFSQHAEKSYQTTVSLSSRDRHFWGQSLHKI